MVVILDQLTKAWVRNNLAIGEVGPEWGPVIRIIHVMNSGAAFGILQGQTSFLIIMSLLGLGAIVLYYVYPPMDHGLIRIALGMQLGGAIGNLHRPRAVRARSRTSSMSATSRRSTSPTRASRRASSIVLGFFLLQEFDENKRSRDTPSRSHLHRPMPDQQTTELVADESGERLDVFVARRMPSLTRSRVQQLIDEGMVLVDGARERASHRLEAGQRVVGDGAGAARESAAQPRRSRSTSSTRTRTCSP